MPARKSAQINEPRYPLPRLWAYPLPIISIIIVGLFIARNPAARMSMELTQHPPIHVPILLQAHPARGVPRVLTCHVFRMVPVPHVRNGTGTFDGLATARGGTQ